MVNIHRHNPALRARLKSAIDSHSAAQLASVLRGLSNSEFRTAGYMLADELLPAPETAEHFWDFFLTIVPENPKAYLGTFLKAASSLYLAGRLDIADERLKAYSTSASPIDCSKVLTAMLPIAKTVKDGEKLLQLFSRDETPCTLLIQAGTAVCCFILFRHLQQHEGDEELIRQQCIRLIKKGEKRSFNLASMLQQYFDIKNLPGCFALSLQPYQLSRLDMTYDKFLKILNS